MRMTMRMPGCCIPGCSRRAPERLAQERHLVEGIEDVDPPASEDRPPEPAPAGVAEPPGGPALAAAEAAEEPLRQRPADGREQHHLDPVGAEPPRPGQNVWTQRDKGHMMPPGGQALGHQAHGVLRAPDANGEVRRVLGKKQYVHQYLDSRRAGLRRGPQA